MFRLNNFEILIPSSIEEASALLKEYPDSMIIAGGTDLIPKLRRSQFEPTHLISLGKLCSLNSIKKKDDSFVLGALTPLCDLEDSSKIRETPEIKAFAEALSVVASPTLRNSATLGGNILQDSRCKFVDKSELWREGVGFCMKKSGTVCRVAPGNPVCSATLCSDLAPALAVLEGEVVFQGPVEKRRVAVRDLYQEDGQRHIKKEPWEILIEVHLPIKERKSLYKKLYLRQSLDFPELGMALSWRKEEGELDICLSFTALSSQLLTFEKTFPRENLEEGLHNWRNEIYDQLKPKDTLYSPPLYRKKVAKNFLEEAFKEIGKEGKDCH